MIYSNPEFILLFLLTFTAYLLAPSYKARFLILLAASILFYAWAGLFDAAIFFFVVAVSWAAAALARRYPRRKRSFITFGILVMTAHLFFWKYSPWVVSQIQLLFPRFLGGRRLTLPLPVGISFFTLQGIAYLVDYMHSDAKYMELPMYVLFKSFFAQLVAGPIVRAWQVLPQLEKLSGPKVSDVSIGLSLFVMGFFKKMVIADRVSPFVDQVFRGPAQFGRGVLISAILGYTVQIWADFSGYTDMGRGAARMLGIKLPENFLSPYFAKCPSEFWKRWHITLSEWIRDYIYIPMGGSRGSVARVFGVVVLTMSISGLWHGAQWHFLVWGLYHGFLLVMERRLPIPAAPLSIPFMFLLTAFGWLVFRAPDCGAILLYMRGIWSNSGSALAPFGKMNVYLGLALCLAAQALFYQDLKTGGYPVLSRLRLPALSPLGGFCAGLGLAAVFLGAVIMHPAGSKAFIYFQF